MIKENVIDAVTSVKDRDLNLIKKLETENQDLKSNMHNFQQIKDDPKKFKNLYQEEKQARELLDQKVAQLSYELGE